MNDEHSTAWFGPVQESERKNDIIGVISSPSYGMRYWSHVVRGSRDHERPEKDRESDRNCDPSWVRKKWLKSHPIANDSQNRQIIPKPIPNDPYFRGSTKSTNFRNEQRQNWCPNGRKAIHTCNIPHSEAVKAKDPNAWVGTHEIFLCQRFRQRLGTIHPSRD
jgi:hypothetical protein